MYLSTNCINLSVTNTLNLNNKAGLTKVNNQNSQISLEGWQGPKKFKPKKEINNNQYSRFLGEHKNELGLMAGLIGLALVIYGIHEHNIYDLIFGTSLGKESIRSMPRDNKLRIIKDFLRRK